jgi:tRNA nucleotidyltransferase/poly(A) polymerase
VEDLLKVIKKHIPSEIDYFYIVGGYVRDMFMKRDKYKDIDMVWPINECEIEKYFKRTFLIKEKTKTFILPVYFKGEKLKIEISPLKGETIEEDLLSRDLTINSMAFKIKKECSEVETLDPCDGIGDLHYKILRCIDEKKFVDDPLRMLRVFRFQASTNFEIDSYTFKAINKYKKLISNSPNELISQELTKIFEGEYCVKAFRNMVKVSLLQEIMPEIEKTISFRHLDKHHKYETVFEHSMRVLQNCKTSQLGIDYAISSLLHDVAKPELFDGKHYLYHEEKGAEISNHILKRLKFSNKTAKNVCSIIKYHMIPLNSHKKMNEMRYLLGKENFKDEIEFINADKSATNTRWVQTDAYRDFMVAVEKVLNSDVFFENMDSKINGDILIKLGLRQSIGIKYIMDYLRSYFFKNPTALSEKRVYELLESNLLYKNKYGSFVFKNKMCERKYEYIKNNKIFGLLKSGEQIIQKTGIFEYHFLSEGDFETWLSINKKEYSLFFS